MENEITKDNGRTIVDWETICCVLKYLLNYRELKLRSER